MEIDRQEKNHSPLIEKRRNGSQLVLRSKLSARIQILSHTDIRDTGFNSNRTFIPAFVSGLPEFEAVAEQGRRIN